MADEKNKPIYLKLMMDFEKWKILDKAESQTHQVFLALRKVTLLFSEKIDNKVHFSAEVIKNIISHLAARDPLFRIYNEHMTDEIIDFYIEGKRPLRHRMRNALQAYKPGIKQSDETKAFLIEAQAILNLHKLWIPLKHQKIQTCVEDYLANVRDATGNMMQCLKENKVIEPVSPELADSQNSPTSTANTNFNLNFVSTFYGFFTSSVMQQNQNFEQEKKPASEKYRVKL